MAKNLLNQKRDALKDLPPREFIDRVLAYPNQQHLNFTEFGLRRNHPLGEMAQKIQDNNYQMTEKQYYSMMHDFASLMVQNVTVQNLTFSDSNREMFVKEPKAVLGEKVRYGVSFRVEPVEDALFDSPTKVSVLSEDGDYQPVGYLPSDFTDAHPIREPLDFSGDMVVANGNVYYQMLIDTEALDLSAKMEQAQAHDKARDNGQIPGQMHLFDFLPEEQQTQEPEKPASPHTYETLFQLTDPVIDYEAARDYLKEKDMAEYLKDHIQYLSDRKGSQISDFHDAISDIQWDLDMETAGRITLTANRELTGQELSVVSEWVSGQNSDGLGEGFEQQPFACYTDPDFDWDDDEDTEPTMASFDWETNSYQFTDITPSLRPDLSLSEADLSFAKEDGMKL